MCALCVCSVCSLSSVLTLLPPFNNQQNRNRLKVWLKGHSKYSIILFGERWPEDPKAEADFFARAKVFMAELNLSRTDPDVSVCSQMCAAPALLLLLCCSCSSSCCCCWWWWWCIQAISLFPSLLTHSLFLPT